MVPGQFSDTLRRRSPEKGTRMSDLYTAGFFDDFDRTSSESAAEIAPTSSTW